MTFLSSSFASSVEISSSLAEKQLETVGEVQSHLSKFTVEHRDTTDIAGWGKLGFLCLAIDVGSFLQ